MVVRICNLSPWERLRQKDLKFEASLGYIAKPCLKQSKTKQKDKIYVICSTMDRTGGHYFK
jgi:hypothetical protein